MNPARSWFAIALALSLALLIAPPSYAHGRNDDDDGRSRISFKSERKSKVQQKFFDKFNHKSRGKIRLFCSAPRKKPGKPRPLNFESVEITFKEVSVFSSQKGWQVVSNAKKTVDLLELTDDASEILADAELDAGEYKMIRLKVKGDVRGRLNGKWVPIDIPLSQQLGLILFGEFEIRPGFNTSINLKFDPDKSIHARGKNSYWMSPIIKIEGTLDGEDDVTAPVISIMSPTGGTTNLTSQTVRIEYSDENLNLSSLSIRLNGTESKSRFQIGPDAATATFQFPQGTTRIEAQVSDSRFTTQAIPVDIVVDSIAPTVTFLSPSSIRHSRSRALKRTAERSKSNLFGLQLFACPRNHRPPEKLPSWSSSMLLNP